MDTNQNKEFHVGTDFRKNEIINKIGTFDNLADAKNACIKGYAVYDEEGRLIYSNRRNRYKVLLLILLFFALATVGGTFAYLNFRGDVQQEILTFPNGTELIYESKDGKPIPDSCGIYKIPESGYKVILDNGSTKFLKYGSLIKSDGTIIEANGNTKLIIDKHCNIIIRGSNGATVTLPNGKEIQVGDGSVINPPGIVVDPKGKDNLTIDEKGNIIVGEGGGKVTLPDGTEIDVPKGTVITPDGKVIIPDTGSNIIIDESGKIIVEDGGATIITIKCGEKHVPKGTIIVPEGTIVIPNGNANITIDSNGYLIVGPGGATIIRNDCTEFVVPPGSVITDDGYVINPEDKNDNGGGTEVDDKGNITITDPDGGTIHTPKCGDIEVPKGTVIVKAGTIIIPKDGSALVIDKFGFIHVPEGGAKVIMPNCSEEEVPEGTIITPEGDVIIPGDEDNDIPEVDDKGNTIFPDDGDGGIIITPDCGKKEVPGGTIIVPGGTIIIPKPGTKLITDKNGNILITEGSAIVVLANCTEEEVPKGTIVTPEGNVIIPGDDKNPPDINDDETIIIDEDDNKTIVIQPGGCKINVPAGSIIYKGLIIIGTSTEKPYVKDGLIIIPPGGKVIYPNCKEVTFPNGGTVDKDGDTSHGLPEDPEAPTPPKPPIIPTPDPDPVPNPDPTTTLSIAYIEGQELNVFGVRPGDVVGSKTFYVKNTGKGTVDYNILWTQVINNFARPQDLVVTIQMNGTIIKNAVPVPTINDIMLGNISITPGQIHEFELVFEYLETGLNQDEDQGKTFSTVVQIAAVQ